MKSYINKHKKAVWEWSVIDDEGRPLARGFAKSKEMAEFRAEDFIGRRESEIQSAKQDQPTPPQP